MVLDQISGAQLFSAGTSNNRSQWQWLSYHRGRDVSESPRGDGGHRILIPTLFPTENQWTRSILLRAWLMDGSQAVLGLWSDEYRNRADLAVAFTCMHEPPSSNSFSCYFTKASVCKRVINLKTSDLRSFTTDCVKISLGDLRWF